MSTSTSLFPDVNVWLALTHKISPQHGAALTWANDLDGTSALHFCRITQLGLLRMLTQQSAMGPDVMTQAEAWRIFEGFLLNHNVSLLDEPTNLERLFRRRTDRDEISPKQWADGYLAAFAEGHHLRLVTFDKALAKATADAVLLRG